MPSRSLVARRFTFLSAAAVAASVAAGCGSDGPTEPGFDIELAAISPNPMVAGENATLTGSGFSETVGANTVTIDGVTATVTQATATSLTVRVPDSQCRPARTVEVRVTAGGGQSNALSHPVRPREFLQLPVGQQLMVQDPANFCLQFDASSAAEAYLIGVQSLSDAPGSLTAVAVGSQRAAADPGTPPFAAAPLAPERTFQPGGPVASPQDATRQERLLRREESKVRLRSWEGAHLGAHARAPAGPAAADGPPTAQVPPIPGTVQVGDVIPIRVSTFTGDFCADFVQINTVVRAVGSRGIWLDDQANPANGFTTADFNAMSVEFDQQIHPAIIDYFGQPSDIDGNGRVVIVMTKEVNRVGDLGFVWGGNLLTRTQCAASNMGEYYFGAVPDPTGQFGERVTKAEIQADRKLIMAHELSHIVQLGRRFVAGSAIMTLWEAEGQATLAEEITGHRLTGRSPGQNYGPDEVFDVEPPWYLRGIAGLVTWYGFISPTQRATNAPEQCSWLGLRDQQPGTPCVTELPIYGVPWSFLRWLSDHFGPAFTGGESGFHRALIDHPTGAFPGIASLIGQPIDVLLTQWAATLYVTDRVPGATARLTLPSWNLVAIENAVVEPARLAPRQRGFADFSDQVSVRGGSVAYFRVSGAGRSATAIGARTPADAALPAHMRFWVVRLQ